MSAFNPGPMPVDGENNSSKSTKILMENAHKSIAERKREMGINETVNSHPGLIADSEAAEKARRLAELKAKIQSKLDSGILEKIKEVKKTETIDPKNVTIDSQGRTIDKETGIEIQLTQYRPTLKANLRAKRSQVFREVIKQTAIQNKKSATYNSSIYFDPRLSLKSSSRPKKHLSFFEPGKFIKQGHQARIKVQLEKLKETVSQAAKQTGIADAAKLATIQPKTKINESAVPNVEWWDQCLLKDGVESYSEIDELGGKPMSSLINEAWITRLIEHPITIKPPTQVNRPIEIPLLLTKKERKKLRRQNRLERQKEEQEKIRLGFLPPPEPKVKLANLMRVLGTTAVQDPSKVEAYVRQQMDARRKNHEVNNASRKLTKEQARYKKIKKLKEDTSVRVYVAVYKVIDLNNPSHRFKVETNANQLHMTGIIALHKDCNVVVVEGGRKQQYKFKRLMLNRIKWDQTDRHNRPKQEAETEEKTEQGQQNCSLIWEGTVSERAFEKVQAKVCPTELYAREIFRKKEVEHYWDSAYSSSLMQTNDDSNDIP